MMTGFEFGLGGQDVREETRDAIKMLDGRRTLLVEHLTHNEPIEAEIVSDLRNMKDVFKHFQPNVDVAFEDESGGMVAENLKFQSVADFRKKGLIEQSDHLKDLNAKQESLIEFMRFLKANKILRKALEDKEAKQAYLNVLQGLIQELEQAE